MCADTSPPLDNDYTLLRDRRRTDALSALALGLNTALCPTRVAGLAARTTARHHRLSTQSCRTAPTDSAIASPGADRTNSSMVRSSAASGSETLTIFWRSWVATIFARSSG